MTTTTRTLAVILGAVALAGAGGCGSGSDDERVEVSGRVTLDDKPLEKGVISLTPVDGKGPLAGAEIIGGEFTTRTTPGEKKVTITAQQVVGERPRDPKDPSGAKYSEMKEIIPERYNKNTTLTLKVGPGGQDDANFDLKSAP